jgi:hypothetical protein
MHGRSSPPVDGSDERPARDEGEDKELGSTDRTWRKPRTTGRAEGRGMEDPPDGQPAHAAEAQPAKAALGRPTSAYGVDLEGENKPMEGEGVRRPQPPPAQRTSTKNKTLERTAPPMKT